MSGDEQRQAVSRMQDYIDSHLTQPITLVQLARASGYSPYHAARLFRRETGLAPFEYIRRMRLAGSAMLLCHGSGHILDVAFDFVFDSHEGFTRAFSREFGMTPQHYRQNQPPIRGFMPERLRGLYRDRNLKRAAAAAARDMRERKGAMNMDEQEKTIREKGEPLASGPAGDVTSRDSQPGLDTVFVQVIERPARRLILKRAVTAEDYYAYCEEVDCDVWDKLASIKDAAYEPAGYWLPESMRRPGTSEYVQGVEVAADYSGPVPDGFELIDLPACQLMLFQGPPFNDEDFENAIGTLWELMDRYDPMLYGYRWADDECPRFQLEPQGYRGYIEGRPVKKSM